MSGYYLVLDVREYFARVSRVERPSENQIFGVIKEEAIFEGTFAELRAREYADWMNGKGGGDGDFDREPSNPYQPHSSSARTMSLPGVRRTSTVLDEEMETGCRVDSRDVL